MSLASLRRLSQEELFQNMNLTPTVSLEKLSQEAVMSASEIKNIDERYVIKKDICISKKDFYNAVGRYLLFSIYYRSNIPDFSNEDWEIAAEDVEITQEGYDIKNQ